MICDKCKKDFQAIQEHHLHPKYMDNPHGYSYNDNVSRIWLYDKCHYEELHRKIIVPILQRFSEKPNYVSEYFLWKNIPSDLKEEVIRITVEETKKWVKDGNCI
jgi:hypothetical protein